MRIFCNFEIPVCEDGKDKIWEASNGATRRNLVIINKLGNSKEIPRNTEFRGSIGFLDKGNHSFIFLNPEKKQDDRVMGIATTTSYGFSCLNPETRQGKTPVYENYSEGGAGNSCSQFAIVEPDTLLKFPTYKNRQSPYYVIFGSSGFPGFQAIDIENVYAEEMTEI